MASTDNEVALTVEQARKILTTPGYNAYGSLRVYAVIGDGEECAGQIAAIKSTYYLDKYTYSRIYAVSNNGTVPVRRA